MGQNKFLNDKDFKEVLQSALKLCGINLTGQEIFVVNDLILLVESKGMETTLKDIAAIRVKHKIHNTF